MNKSKRISTAKTSLRILENGYYTNPNGEIVEVGELQKAAVVNTYLYSNEPTISLVEKALLHKNDFNTTFAVTAQTTLNEVRSQISQQYKNVFCLNFASARNPGGGVLTGAQAQEESIARATGLYPCLMTAMEYYETNRQQKSCLYTDGMIYSPAVPILCDEKGVLANEVKTVSILTAPAVNTGVVKRKEPKNISKIAPTMRRRIDKVLAIAKIHGHETLVLGAWGCGVFQNDPNEIAKYFKDALTNQFKGQFRKVVFAIYSRNERFILPFQKEFL